MEIRVLTSVLLLLTCFSGFTQTNDLQLILDQDISSGVKSIKIDSFIRTLPQNKNLRSAADYHHDLGSKWFFKNWRTSDRSNSNDLVHAIRFTEEAIDRKEQLDSVDIKSIKKSLYNLGVFQNFNDDVFGAIASYGKLISLGEPDSKTQLANREIAKLYWQIGDFRKAVQRFENCIEYYKKDPDYDYFLLEIHVNLADLHASMGYIQNADQIFNHLKIAEAIMAKNNLEDPFSHAQILQIYGNLYIELGEFEKALTYQKQLLLTPEYFSDENLAKINNSIGVCYMRLGNYSKSKAFLHKAIGLNNRYSSPLENLGDVFIAQNDYVKGIDYYKQSIQLVTLNTTNANGINELPNDNIIEITNDKLSLLNHLTTLANGWLKYYKHDNKTQYLNQALNTFKKADLLIDFIKRESNEYQSKLYWREQSAHLYMNAIEACYLLKKPEEAYYFMERNKAMLLLENLTHEDAKEVGGIPNAIAAREFQLKKAIHLSENRLLQEMDSENKDTGAFTSLKDTVFKTKYRYRQFIDSLESTFPNYAKFKDNITTISLENLKTNGLESDNAIVYYALNEAQGYGLYIDRDGTSLFPLRQVGRLNENIVELIKMLSNHTSDMNAFKALSHEIFRNLIPENIQQKIKNKKITIIPDYTLQRIPFETFVTNKKELRYLFQEVEISYAYSATLLEHSRQQKDAPKEFIAIAPITFNNSTLPKLHFSEKEVQGISTYFTGMTLLNNEASKTNFINKIGDAKIIHLATHADIGTNDNPWIAFKDSKMYLKEIYSTKNSADMVVLSACNTSSGELKRGEGIMSLATGFFYSGSKSVVSSLWPIVDGAGNNIIVNFYQNLDQGFSKSKALQQAKLNYLDNTEVEVLKHPFYWAGFIVLGDNAPISNPSNTTILYIFGCSIILIAFFVFLFKKLKARQAVA